MVRHFVRLKLRVLANRFRTQPVIGAIGYVAIWAAGVLGGVMGGLAVFGLGRITGEPAAVLSVAYTAVFVGWAIIPASVAALDETLDARRFELLPIAPRRLVSGLLAAGAVSPGAAGTFIGLIIANFASYPEWSLVPVILAAVIVELAMCLVAARLVTTFLSNLLASRRTRELVTLGFGLLIGLVVLLPTLFSSPDETGSMDVEITITSLDWVEDLAWFPPGALAMSVSRVADGAVLQGSGLAVYGTAATVLIGMAWAQSVRSMLVRTPTRSRTGRRRDDDGRTLALVPSWMRRLRSPVAGVAAKELRYLMRDNRVRAQLMGSLVPIPVIAVAIHQSFSETPFAPFLAAGFAFLIVLGALANQFGADGGSFWGYVVSSTPLSTVVLGKNIGWGLVAAPLVLVGAAALAWWAGDFTYYVAAVFGSASVLLVSAAVGNLTSIYGAYRIPESNPFGTGRGSAAAFIPVILGMMASGALLIPIAALIALPSALFGPVAATVGALITVGYGFLIHRLGMGLASRLLVERQQPLLDAIDRELG